jgi:Protein of unknown function (DUF3168)
MSIPDPVALVRELLLADAAVAALAGDNIFVGELPERLNASPPPAAVVIAPAGGPGRAGTLRYRRNRVDTVCYAATLESAWTLHLAVREALETMTVDGALRSIEASSDGALARDPQTQWPTCYASYLVGSVTDA